MVLQLFAVHYANEVRKLVKNMRALA